MPFPVKDDIPVPWRRLKRRVVSLRVLPAVHLAGVLGCSKPTFLLFVWEFSAKGLLLENVVVTKRNLSWECFHSMKALGRPSSWIQEEKTGKKGCERVYFG